MAVKIYKPTSPGRRGMTSATFEEITKSTPERSLTSSLKRSGGRDYTGTISIRHRGGGARRAWRQIDFKRDKLNIPARVASIEYDPNRSARIALLNYADGEKRYILWPDGLKVGAEVMSGETAEVNLGNALPLRKIPLGTVVHNIELKIGKGGQMVRSAGGGAQLMARDGHWAQVKLPSGEVRRVHVECYATVGLVGNLDHENVSIGKAGRNRWLGWKPHNRGVTMNPVDHPMGGGEGRTSGGRHPTTPWGLPTKGYKTRNNKRTDGMIVRRRNKK